MSKCELHKVADPICPTCQQINPRHTMRKPNKRAEAAQGRRLKRMVSTRLANQHLAQAATERVARRVQEVEGRWDTPASLDMKATIYHEILDVLNNGVEC